MQFNDAHALRQRGKGKGVWRPSAEVAKRHLGHWRYLAKKEGDFRIELSEQGQGWGHRVIFNRLEWSTRKTPLRHLKTLKKS